jgi:predicted nucleic acid-binding protein
MPKENWGSFEGIVDIGPIVVAHCDNPSKDKMIEFIADIISGERRAIIPISCFIGAYHVLTRYLRITRQNAVSALEKTLEIDSPAYYEEISRSRAIQAIQFASIYNIQGWDGYLLSLAQTFGTRIIFTLDQNLGKAEGFSAVLPIPESDIRKYHEWIRQWQNSQKKSK